MLFYGHIYCFMDLEIKRKYDLWHKRITCNQNIISFVKCDMIMACMLNKQLFFQIYAYNPITLKIKLQKINGILTFAIIEIAKWFFSFCLWNICAYDDIKYLKHEVAVYCTIYGIHYFLVWSLHFWFSFHSYIDYLSYTECT